MNCTMDKLDELKLQHRNLENTLSLLQKTFDEKNIATTDLKNQFTMFKQKENKYLQEINDLQNTEEDEVRILKDKLKLLQSEVKCTEESLELELFKEDEEVFNLQDELDSLPNPDNEDVEENDEEVLEEMFKTNLDLETRLEKLNVDKDEIEVKLQDIQNENEELSNFIQNMNDDLEHSQQSLQFKSEEVGHAYKKLREIDEKCLSTNNELKSLSDKSLSLVDEGSIFSEVNNRRLNLSESINKFEIDCKNLIKKKLTVQKKLSQFRSKHQKLKSLFKSEMEDDQYDNKCLFIYTTSRNKILEELVHVFNRIINDKLKLIDEGLPSDGVRYLHKYANNLEETIKKWQESQNTRRLSIFMISSDLRHSNLKLNEEQNQSLQLESKVVELQSNIENFKVEQKENIKPSTSVNIMPDVPASLLVVNNKEHKKANIGKKVAFTADVLESKPSDSHQVKRGKILKYKTMLID